MTIIIYQSIYIIINLITLVLSLNLIPCLVMILWNCLLISMSMPMPPTWPRNSTAVTWNKQISIYEYIFLSIYNNISFYISMNISFYLSMNISMYLWLYLSIQHDKGILQLLPEIYRYLFIYLSIYLSLYLSIYLSISLSLYLSSIYPLSKSLSNMTKEFYSYHLK